MGSAPRDRRRSVADGTWRRTQLGFTLFLDVATPWLLELGTWIFGALIAFDLVILGVVLTIGPVDYAVKIATTAFGLSLPPSVVGFVLLRLVTDMRKIRLQDTATQAFQDAGFNLEDRPQVDVKKIERRMSSVTLIYTYSLMAVTLFLTLIGLTAALWHSAWWIGVAFLVMLGISLLVLVLAAAQLGGGRDEVWLGPGEPPKTR